MWLHKPSFDCIPKSLLNLKALIPTRTLTWLCIVRAMNRKGNPTKTNLVSFIQETSILLNKGCDDCDTCEVLYCSHSTLSDMQLQNKSNADYECLQILCRLIKWFVVCLDKSISAQSCMWWTSQGRKEKMGGIETLFVSETCLIPSELCAQICPS